MNEMRIHFELTMGSDRNYVQDSQFDVYGDESKLQEIVGSLNTFLESITHAQ